MDISNQLIKDSYDYVLQSDLSTGIVYRIGGQVPLNPIFQSGLTILDTFRFSNGTEQNGYALICDASGNANWQSLTDNDIFITGFTYNNNTFSISDNSGTTYNATINDVTGLTINGDLFVTGNTSLIGLTATTISATTFQGLPLDLYVTGGSYFNGTLTLTRQDGSFPITGFSQYFITGSTPTGITINYGDRWYDINSGIELVFITDGDSEQWVQPSNNPGPQGPPGYSNLMITSGISTNDLVLDININYYGVTHAGIIDLYLPDPTGYDGYNMNIKDESGNSSIYRIRLIPLAGLIDNTNYVDMNTDYMSLHVVARNNNWWII